MSETTTIANDAGKALEALTIATNTIATAQSTMTADQHKDVVSKALDLANVAGTSLTALAASGAVGEADAQHITDGVHAVESSEGLVGLFSGFIAKMKSAFSWL